MIRQLVTRLIEAGVPAEMAAEVIMEAYTAGQEPFIRQSYDKNDSRNEALILKKDIKKEKKVRATKQRLSPDWKPSEGHYEAAAKLNIPRSAVDDKAEDLRIWAGSTGATKVDWDLTFHGFLRRDVVKLAVAPPLKSVDLPGFYCAFGSPQLEAWTDYEHKTGKRKPRDKHGGWRYETEWPPAREEANA
jgi:hypothetical protein